MLKPSLEDFKQDFTSMGDGLNCPVVWTFFSTALLGNWNEDWPFPVLWPLLWVFQICWHIECTTLIASSFRILNRSPGIPSSVLALLEAVLPKAYLTSHSRKSGFEWETIPSWLSESLRSFLYTSSVYSFHLFLISSAFIRSLRFHRFCSLLCPSLDKMFTSISFSVKWE